MRQRARAVISVGTHLALLGPSGVGKSTIVNRLVGRELLATGDVRDWDAAAATRASIVSSSVREAGGLIIDTPGMRELQLWDTGGLDDTFADIAELADSAGFAIAVTIASPAAR